MIDIETAISVAMATAFRKALQAATMDGVRVNGFWLPPENQDAGADANKDVSSPLIYINVAPNKPMGWSGGKCSPIRECETDIIMVTQPHSDQDASKLKKMLRVVRGVLDQHKPFDFGPGVNARGHLITDATKPELTDRGQMVALGVMVTVSV